MTTGYIEESILISMLQCLTADNALCIRCLLATGMRINDCLSLKREAVKATYSMNPLSPLLIYREAKTGKLREVNLSPQLCLELTERPMQKSEWCFPGRDATKHRTRQAVWKDLKRVSKLYRVNHKRILANIGPHTARKVYAVKLYREAEKKGLYEPLEVVRKDLNHADRAVTFLYALADKVSGKSRRLT